MECEKFEPLLLDELYEELDELTSAAVKRHVAGCARCGAILNGLRSTRRGVSLALVPVPDGLEDRILAAAREATKVVPIKSRMSRALTVAGSWAMRPQTAMAAVFLLMIGTSAFLIRSKNYAAKDAAVSVTVEGAPSPVAAGSTNESVDDKAAAAAHGPSMPPNVTRPPAQPMASVALDDGPVDRLTGGAARAKGKEDSNALGSALAEAKDEKSAMNAPAPNAQPVAPPTAAAIANAAAPAGAGAYDYSQSAQVPAKPASRKGPDDAQDPFSLGAAAFRARNYAEATKNFDRAAQAGDNNAALWAAQSVREGQGCAVALGRFDQVATRASGSWVGNEASLRAAQCQIALGQLDGARDRLNRLTQVASHQQAAQQALTELNAVATKKASGGGSGGANAAPRRAAPMPKAPAPSETRNNSF